jgi:hypothetical protein
MKKKLFMLLALAVTTLTASAEDVPTYSLTKADGAEAHGTITFKVDDATVSTAQEGQTVTVEIAPAEGYIVSEPSGQWYAAIAAAPRRTSIDLLNTITLTPVEGKDNTWTFTMERANAEISCSYKKQLQASWVQDIDAVSYNGAEKKPTVIVKDGETTLVLDVDYTVSYSNNVNAGTATVTITAAEGSSYTGTVVKTFTINKANAEVTYYPGFLDKTYGDPDFTLVPDVYGEGDLVYSSDNESIATVNATTGQVTIKAVGEVRIWATLQDNANYNGTYDNYVLTVYPKEVAYEGGTITQDENGYTVTLTEDPNSPSAQPLPADADLVGLTYSRTLKAPATGEGDLAIDGKAANLFTVCLPFAPKTDEAAKYYTLSAVSGETLVFDEVTAPAVNTPYLVAVTGSVNFLEDCADLTVASMKIASTTKDGYTFTGTFTGMTNAQAAGKYILQKGNTWGKVTTEKAAAYIPPFRAYVEAPATAAPMLNATIDNTTGIRNIRTVDQDGTERWYDLNGRRIATPVKGINIVNGKKVVVK